MTDSARGRALEIARTLRAQQLLAHAQQLHDRVRQLRDALASLHRTAAAPHVAARQIDLVSEIDAGSAGREATVAESLDVTFAEVDAELARISAMVARLITATSTLQALSGASRAPEPPPQAVPTPEPQLAASVAGDPDTVPPESAEPVLSESPDDAAADAAPESSAPTFVFVDVPEQAPGPELSVPAPNGHRGRIFEGRHLRAWPPRVGPGRGPGQPEPAEGSHRMTWRGALVLALVVVIVLVPLLIYWLHLFGSSGSTGGAPSRLPRVVIERAVTVSAGLPWTGAVRANGEG